MRHQPDSSAFDAEYLGKYVRRKRGNLGLRATAKEIGGISASTLGRVEKGHVPDLDTFIRLCRWIGVPPSTFMKDFRENERFSGQSTPEVIAAHFRADQALDARTAKSLSGAVKALYEAAKEGKI
ncbi:MAG: helix-turn-helix transcriptional regulator [Bacteroidetes bacterium]|nr:helix-turn-helix transcriptional regulator [Bacteroidota bacterium]